MATLTGRVKSPPLQREVRRDNHPNGTTAYTFLKDVHGVALGCAHEK